MLLPELPPNPCAAARFGWIMANLWAAVLTMALPGTSGSLVRGMRGRVSRVALRFAKLVEQIRSGTVPAPRPPRTTKRTARTPTPLSLGAAEEMPVSDMPRRFGWLRGWFGGVDDYARMLRVLLLDPEMAELVAAEPRRMARLFRPLCHILGLEPPEGMFPPLAERKKRASRSEGAESNARPPRPRDEAAPGVVVPSEAAGPTAPSLPAPSLPAPSPPEPPPPAPPLWPSADPREYRPRIPIGNLIGLLMMR